MAFGTVNLGRVQLREDSLFDLVNGDLGRYHLNLSGQESMPRIASISLKQRAQDITGLQGQLLPVTFAQKPEFDGFYVVHSISAAYDRWMPEDAAVMSWSATLLRAGGTGDMDLESRLSGPQTRVNDHSATGVRWQAPALGAKAWAAGSTPPTVFSRTGSYGAMSVYTGIPLGQNPRWGVTPAEYSSGRCRILDGNSLERLSVNAPLDNLWKMDNGLARVSLDVSGNIIVDAYTGGAWQDKSWTIQHGGGLDPMGAPDYCSLTRYDFESVSVRLTKSLSPGRMTVDLTLRRGSRFVEVFVQHLFGTTLKIVRTTAEAGSASTGYVSATAADGDGNKYVLGSAKSFTGDLVNGGISKAATATLDAFIGVEITTPPTGDAASNLFQQYLGAPVEMVQGVSR